MKSKIVSEGNLLYDLQSFRKFCLGMRTGWECEVIYLGEALPQDKASELAFQINQEREGYVWITTVFVDFDADPKVTRLSVRCTA